jgi:hypothetical protein
MSFSAMSFSSGQKHCQGMSIPLFIGVRFDFWKGRLYAIKSFFLDGNARSGELHLLIQVTTYLRNLDVVSPGVRGARQLVYP